MFHSSTLPAHTRALLLCMFLLLSLFVSPALLTHAAGVVFVAPSGAGTRTGADWANASDLQAALASATSGTQLWVKAGTYRPTTSSDRSVSFQLKSGVALYGGFAGSETALAQRDFAANETILSGDLLMNDTGVVTFTNSTRADNSYHVVSIIDADSSTKIDGFTIQDGSGTRRPAPDFFYIGGGIFIYASSPVVQNIKFCNNSSDIGGGLATISGYTNVTKSYPSINHIVFVNNLADWGGAIYSSASKMTIKHSMFMENFAITVGGGIYSENYSDFYISNSLFSGNKAFSGGAIANGGSKTAIYQTTFVMNIAKHAGVLATQDLNQFANIDIIHNSFLWGNGSIPIYSFSNSIPDIQYSLVQGGYISGTHILDADPLFVDADGADNIAGTLDDDLRLQTASPAIDAGNNAFIPADSADENHNGNTSEPAPFDLAGNPRVNGLTVDLGAYEAQVHLAFTSAPPASGRYGSSYIHSFSSATSAPMTYTLAAGSLPPGLTLSGTGVLAGMPSAAGSYSMTVIASDGQDSASQSFTLAIAPAPLTIAADSKVKHVGSANPPLSASYYGLVNNDTPASLSTPVALTTTADLNSPAGSYPIYASGSSSPNYAITFANGTLTTTAKLVPEISWPAPQAIVYGTALDATQLNATASVPGTFSYAPELGTNLKSGNSQPLVATFMPDDAATYAMLQATVSIDVVPATLTVQADDQRTLVGSSIPPLTASVQGFVLDDSDELLAGSANCTTTATSASSVGSYPITCTAGTLAAANYRFVFIPGTLTLEPAAMRRLFVPLLSR